MIDQFVALGRYFSRADGKADDPISYAQDPSLKFKSANVFLLVFGSKGFLRVQVEEYSRERKGWYLYRAGPANGFDATPTTGLPNWKPPEDEKKFRENTGKRLVGFVNSSSTSSQAHRKAQSVSNLSAWEQAHRLKVWSYSDTMLCLNTALLSFYLSHQFGRWPRRKCARVPGYAAGE